MSEYYWDPNYFMITPDKIMKSGLKKYLLAHFQL